MSLLVYLLNQIVPAMDFAAIARVVFLASGFAMGSSIAKIFPMRKAALIAPRGSFIAAIMFVSIRMISVMALRIALMGATRDNAVSQLYY